MDTLQGVLATLPRPIGTIVHVGAGTGEGLDYHAALQPQRLVVVEGDPETAASLAFTCNELPNTHVVTAPVAAVAGATNWIRYNLAALNGTVDVDSLVEFYPRLRRLETCSVGAVAFSALLKEQACAPMEQATNVLVLDVPGQEGALIESLDEEAIACFDAIIVRSCREEIHTHTPPCTAVATLARNGFELTVADDISEPLWPVHAYRLDRPARLARTRQARIDELTHLLQVEREEATALRASMLEAEQNAQETAAQLQTKDETARSQASRVAALQRDLDDRDVALKDRDAHIDRLTAQCSERDARIVQMGDALADGNAAVQRLAGTLADREGEAQQLARTLDEREADIGQLKDLLGDHATRIEQLSGALAERDVRIEHLGRTLAERDEGIARLHSALTERDANIDELKRSLADQVSAFKQLALTLDARDAEVQQLRRAAGERDAVVEKLTRDIDEREASLAERTDVIRAHEAELKQLALDIAGRDSRIEQLGAELLHAEQAAAEQASRMVQMARDADEAATNARMLLEAQLERNELLTNSVSHQDASLKRMAITLRESEETAGRLALAEGELRAKLAESAARLDELANEHRRLLDAHERQRALDSAALESALAQSDALRREMGIEIERLTAECREYATRIDDAQSHVARLEAELERTQVEFQVRMQALDSAAEARSAELEASRADALAAHAEAAAHATTIERLEQSGNAMSAHLAELQQRAQRLDGERTHFEGLASAQANELERVRSELQQHRVESDALQHQLDARTRELEDQIRRAEAALTKSAELAAAHAEQERKNAEQSSRTQQELADARQAAALSLKLQTLREADLRELQGRYRQAMEQQQAQKELLTKLAQRLGTANYYFRQLADEAHTETLKQAAAVSDSRPLRRRRARPDRLQAHAESGTRSAGTADVEDGSPNA